MAWASLLFGLVAAEQCSAHNPPQRKEEPRPTTQPSKEANQNKRWAQLATRVCWLLFLCSFVVVELGCSLRFIVQSAAAGGSSSSLAGCRAAVPPLTHPIQRLFACFASFSIRSGRPSPSTLFFFTSSPIRKSELREKKELNGQPQLIDSFTKQKEK